MDGQYIYQFSVNNAIVWALNYYWNHAPLPIKATGSGQVVLFTTHLPFITTFSTKAHLPETPTGYVYHTHRCTPTDSTSSDVTNHRPPEGRERTHAWSRHLSPAGHASRRLQQRHASWRFTYATSAINDVLVFGVSTGDINVINRGVFEKWSNREIISETCYFVLKFPDKVKIVISASVFHSVHWSTFPRKHQLLVKHAYVAPLSTYVSPVCQWAKQRIRKTKPCAAGNLQQDLTLTR
jgi:hypothetical protein